MPTPTQLLSKLVETKLAYDDAVRELYGAVPPGVYSVSVPASGLGHTLYHVQVYSFNTPDVRGPVRKL